MTIVRGMNKLVDFHSQANVCRRPEHQKVTAGPAVQVINLFSRNLGRTTGSACVCPVIRRNAICLSCGVADATMLCRAVIPVSHYHSSFPACFVFRRTHVVLKSLLFATRGVDVHVTDLYYNVYVCS